MKLYLNELAPWERKREYLNHIQLGKDVKAQTSILKDAINNQTRAQLASANALIVSQKDIVDGIGNLAIGLDDIGKGLEGLQATFDLGISEVVWQIEQNREALKNILEVLMAPLDTQAKERKKRADDAYANGWIEDAEEEYLESERLNKFDFSIHISLGLIYFFHKIDKEKALDYFEKAIRYAKPKSAFYHSYSLLYKSIILYDFGEIDKALDTVNLAVDVAPEFSEALYFKAVCKYKLGDLDACITLLKKVIIRDKLYSLKIANDVLFTEDNGNILEIILNSYKTEIKDIYNQLSHRLKLFKLVWNSTGFLYAFSDADFFSSRFKTKIGPDYLKYYLDANPGFIMKVEQHTELKTIFDAVDIFNFHKNVEKHLDYIFKELKNKKDALYEVIEKLQDSIVRAESDLLEAKEAANSNIISLLFDSNKRELKKLYNHDTKYVYDREFILSHYPEALQSLKSLIQEL